MPVIANCNVRGIGVAVRVSTWVSARNSFSRSLCFTPKCCSSSTMIRPNSRNLIVFAKSAWVPMTISTVPSVRPALVSLACLAATSRESWRTLTGNPLKRSVKFLKCWRTNNVVGAMTATWRPEIAATKAARKATSVLPKPTSPQISRSIGWPLAKSSRTLPIALSWSSVSA